MKKLEEQRPLEMDQAALVGHWYHVHKIAAECGGKIQRILEEIELIVLLRGLEQGDGFGPHRSNTIVQDHPDLWELQGEALKVALYTKVFFQDLNIINWEQEEASLQVLRDFMKKDFPCTEQ